MCHDPGCAFALHFACLWKCPLQPGKEIFEYVDTAQAELVSEVMGSGYKMAHYHILYQLILFSQNLSLRVSICGVHPGKL